ncbi:tape measure protein [Leuconostoc sp. C2]|uniref:phage tail protein n=1 Tax=Leuconostoc sp. (strain C2) TaxID=979982 RepID=UPI0002175BB5|nr:tape measure protein [Leuconostoc sp. C2]AEJ31422.1 minor tail protein gp26-like protein [Leuconostoc sp. C2]
MESYSVQAVLSAVDKNFSKTFASATKVADSFGNNTTKSTGLGGKGMIKFGAVAGAATAVVSKALSVVTSNVGNAIDRFDTLNKYPVVMKALGYSTQDTGKSMKLLSNGIDGLPTSLNEITSAAQQFAPLTGSATSGAKAALALNDAFLASGASVADTSRGMQQYTQMLATGKVDIQSWRTLQETMPIALRKTANAFGFTGKAAEQDLYKALQSGSITIDDLNKKFVELDKGQNGFATLARKNSVGIKTSFTNLGTAVTKGLAGTLTAIDNGLKNAKLGGIADLINSMKGGINTAFDAINSTITTYIPVIVNTIKTLFDFVKSNASWITPLVIGIGTFVAAMKTMMTIISIVSAVGKAYTALKTAMVIGQAVAGVISGSQSAASALTFMAGESKLAALALKLLGGAFPGMIIIAAITAVVAALVWFFTQTKTGQAIWQGFMSFLSSAWTAMSSFLIGIWNTLGSVFSTIWQALVPIIQNLVTMLQSIWTGYVTSATAVWNGLVSIASGVWNLLKSVILGPILLLIDLLTGNWSQMQIDAVMIWNNIKISLGQIVSGIVTAISGYFKGLGQMLSGIWNSVNSAASSIWNAISSTIRNLANSAINGVKSTWSGITGWASSLWNGVKSAVSSIWSAIVSVVSSMASNAFNSLRGAWSGVSGFVSGLWNSARSAISGAWSGIVSTIRSMASNAFGSLRSAWGGVVGWVSGIWNSVKGAIMGAMNFSLFGAGSAIMNGFLNGLRSVWGAITSFVGGIASWIRRHKGPIQYDRKLLIPAGNAIMGGLNAGLVDNFKTVQKNVSGMAGSILDAATSVGNLATNAIGDPINALNNNIGGSYSSVMTLDHTSTTQPANITIGFDKHGYTAYVDDINNQQGKTALLKRNNSVQL